jgi:hypothetical protein
MTVNTLSQEVSTFKILSHKNLHYMKKQLVCARHLQFVELKMAELYSFQTCIKTRPRLQTCTCFSSTEYYNCPGKMDMMFL